MVRPQEAIMSNAVDFSELADLFEKVSEIFEGLATKEEEGTQCCDCKPDIFTQKYIEHLKSELDTFHSEIEELHKQLKVKEEKCQDLIARNMALVIELAECKRNRCTTKPSWG